MSALIEEAKALTWEHFREVALFELDSGRRAIVMGGSFGIDLDRTVANDPFGRPPNQLLVEIENEDQRVAKLVFHTHPKPTGPSDDDLMVLILLQQDRSMLYELFGDRDGTEIRPKRVEP